MKLHIKIVFLFILVVSLFWATLFILWNYSETLLLGEFETLIYPHKRIDWHDYQFIEYENSRIGPGERSGYELVSQADIEKNEKLFNRYGLSVGVSNEISVSRALPDPRNL